MYKYYVCVKQLQEGERISDQELWTEYFDGKRTYRELATAHKRDSVK